MREQMLPDDQSVSAVLGQPPGLVLAWVQRHSAAIDCGEDWQALAYGVSSEIGINSSLTDSEALALSRAAVLVYDRLGEVCSRPSDRSSFIESGMSVRAFVIKRFGPQPDDPVQDPAILEEWFFQRLGMPYEQAVSMNKDSLKLTTEDFLRVSS